MSRNDLRGANVLVTGCSGFIGSNLCTRLLSEFGCCVVGIDSITPKFTKDGARESLSSGNKPFSFKQLDISNGMEVEDVFNQNEFDFIFHLAALANPRACKQDFGLAFHVNVVGTKNILERSDKASRLVFMSSAAVYGNPLTLPISEMHPRNGNDPYSISKIMGEDLCLCFFNNYDHDICIARNFNTFGDGQIGDYIIPTLIKQAVTERKIEIWNSKPIRDFMYIDDAVNALVTIARQGGAGEVYNIGTGKGTTIGSLATTMRNMVDQKMNVNDMEKQVLGSSELVADSRKLASLGWKPKVQFEDGLRRTIDWFKYTNPVVAN
jgi:nucleoside-diphosphate-sugar epimerase